MDRRSGSQAPAVHLAAAVPEPPRAPPFRALFDEHFPYVCASLRRMGVAELDCEDAAIEVFCRVHARIDDYDARRPVKPWLFAFVARVASEFRRRRRRSLERSDGLQHELASTDPTPAEHLIHRSERRLVLDALDTLDPDKRTVFVLHDLDGCSVPEIAAALGVPEGTVYTRLRAARAKFTAAITRQSGKSRAR